ncbi:MAG TPA: S8 family serine peptidase, partial [Vicinamibacterales bacterium]|nr:S8 family serine peptidase [Vicinamibacterales bacterium]
MAATDRAPDRGFEPRIGRSVSIDHAAALLGVSRRTIYNRIRDGRLHTVRTIGGSQRVTLESVEGLSRRPVEGAQDKTSRAPSQVATAIVTLLLLATSIRPAAAEPRARLSEDLTQHLALGSQTIDVILHGDAATVERLARKYNLSIQKPMRSGAVVRLNASQLAVLQSDGEVDHLSGDLRIRALGDVTAETIGADQVWAGAGSLRPLNGKGVTVAVIDSGIDTRHVALRDRVIASVDFTGGDGMDRYGHGTHVASLIAGGGGATPETAAYRGIAYGAYLVNLRALGDDGSGSASNVIEAIDWAIENRHR